MKVKELIEILSQLPPDKHVMAENKSGIMDDIRVIPDAGPCIVEIRTVSK